MKSKLLSLLLATVMLLTMLPLGAVGVSAATTGITGDCTWDYNSTTKTLTVSGAGTAYTVDDWKDLEKEVVVFEEGVTYVGGSSFIYTYGDVGVLVIPSTLTDCGSETFMCGANTVILNSEAIAEKATTYDAAGYLFYQNTTVLVADSITSMGGYITDGKAYTDSVSVCGKLYRAYSKHSHDFTDAPATRFNGLYCMECFMPKDNAPTTLTYDVVDGEATITGYTGSHPTDLVIPSTIGGYPVTTIGNRAFYDCTSLTSVTIPDSVTSIGFAAFVCCDNLTSVTIPDSVTTIGESAFSNCISLTSVTIPNSVITIDGLAFYYCPSLTEITIPDSVTTIGESAFSDCISLTSVTIGDSVTTIGESAFRNCDSLTSITIPDSVTTIGENAFLFTGYYNKSANWENGVLYIGKHLVSVKSTVPNSYAIKDGTLTIAARAFYKQSNLTSIVIPNSVTAIGEAAFGNTGLTSVTIPGSVTTINDDTFSYCNNLTSVIIENGVTAINDWAFSDCTNLRSLTAPDSISFVGWGAFSHTAYYEDAANREGGVLYIGKCLVDADTTISGDYTVKDGTLTIATYAFSSCTNLTSVTIPDSVVAINDDAFTSCKNLTSIDFGSGVTTIGEYAFFECDGLTAITLPDSVTTIGEAAFRQSNNLSSVILGDGVTTIGKSAFQNCYNLTTVTFNDRLTFVGESAFRSTGLISADIMGHSAVIEAYAFYDCRKLASVTLSDSIASIGDNAFQFCAALTNVYYGGSEGDKANISIGSSNDYLLNATWHYADDPIADEVQHSVMDTANGNGLAFRFELSATGVQKDNKNVVDLTNATIDYLGKECKLIGMGAVVTNDDTAAKNLTLDAVNDFNVIDIPTVYLQEADDDSCAFATRIIDIPDTSLERVIYARPYYIVEVDGEQITVYDDVNSATCAEYL